MSQEELQSHIARLERIIEISRSLNSTLNLPRLLHQILEAAQELTQTEACSIILQDRKSGDLRFEATIGARSHEVRSLVVPMDGSIAGWVVQHNQPVVVHDVQNDPRFYRRVDQEVGFETRSILAVPLAVRGKPIGVLEVLNKKDGKPFNEEDIEILTVLADQAAVAIENAVLFQQSDLVADLVHEMRTPLTSIIGYAAMIERDDVSEEDRKQFARTIEREAARLSRMASDFLELARLESGRAFPTWEEVSLKSLVKDVLALLHPQAEAKRIVLIDEVPDDLPMLTGDPQRLHQALVNLVGNAVKYCREGDRVTVGARVEGDEVLFYVSDTGPGIPASAQEHLFERFYRLPRSENEAEGAGLGLAITRRIIEAHGGRIWVESEEGKGATFYFTLPLRGDGNHRGTEDTEKK
ncbi:MAG TPA: GAF domain-containing sensor histidine kinase [Thermoflexia bacterium]|jgi:signal transduction histidine kinase|nr:GAF domain-containing sensor histidine kinase [Thermoflexia bacterium]